MRRIAICWILVLAAGAMSCGCGSSPGAAEDRACRAFASGSLDEAGERARRWLESDSTSTPPRFLLSVIEFMREDYGGHREQYVHWSAGDSISASIDAFTSAVVAEYPESGRAHFLRAVYLDGILRLEQALEEYDRAGRLDEGIAYVRTCRDVARMLADFGEHPTVGGLKFSKDAIHKMNRNILVRYAFRNSATRMMQAKFFGEFELASASRRILLPIDGKSEIQGSFRVELGSTQMSGEFDECARIYGDKMGINSVGWGAVVCRGRILVTAGEAEFMFSQAKRCYARQSFSCTPFDYHMRLFIISAGDEADQDFVLPIQSRYDLVYCSTPDTVSFRGDIFKEEGTLSGFVMGGDDWNTFGDVRVIIPDGYGEIRGSFGVVPASSDGMQAAF